MTEPNDTTAWAAKDLSREYPRPMDARLAGYPWLPRMIDKARAAQAGTLGGYYRYPCPIDSACLDLLRVDAASFREIACRVSIDLDVLHELGFVGAHLQGLAPFDPVRFNAELHTSDR